jgi:anti-sigma factor RsiW
MKINHLTDEDIQTYAEGNGKRPLPEIKDHLKTCTHCRIRVQAYEHLFTALSADPEYRIPSGAIQKVMNQLPQYAGSTHLFPATETILISAGILTALGATFIFVDLSPILDWIQNLTLPRIIFNPRFIKSMGPLFKHLTGVVGLLPFAVLAFSMVALMDRLIKRFKHSNLLL